MEGAVVPALGVLEFQVVIEEVVAFDEFAAIPLGHIASLKDQLQNPNKQPKLTPLG